jgi:drug/metabolite transporter (DMT)-like permease
LSVFCYMIVLSEKYEEIRGEKRKMTQKQNTLTKTGIVALLACVCCILWGSAIPVIKTGYRLMEVDAADTASQIVFAGVRFTLAGLLVLIFASIREKKVLIPDRTILKYAVPVCLAQTVGQYFFFYIGVAHTSGVKGGIITGLGNFIAILMACLIVRNERMTGRKMAGCVLGFAGVVVINLMGKSLDMGFTLTGEGFILISQVAYGISTILINIYSKKVSPVVLSGTQFTMGGVVLTLIGIGMGGHLGNITAVGVVIIFYLAMVSAVAYTLWSVLLAWNDVSKVAIFGFVNPLCSVILSALILGEVKQAFNTGSLVALLLVCAGIYIVNCKAKQKN